MKGETSAVKPCQPTMARTVHHNSAVGVGGSGGGVMRAQMSPVALKGWCGRVGRVGEKWQNGEAGMRRRQVAGGGVRLAGSVMPGKW